MSLEQGAEGANVPTTSRPQALELVLKAGKDMGTFTFTGFQTNYLLIYYETAHTLYIYLFILF